MNIVNSEIYAVAITVVTIIDYLFRFRNKFDKNSGLYIRFLFYLLILSLLNILISIHTNNTNLRFLFLSIAFTLAYLPPVCIYDYIETNYLKSKYFIENRLFCKVLYFIVAATTLLFVFSSPRTISLIPTHLTGSNYLNNLLIFSLIPVFLLLIEYILLIFKSKKKINYRLLFSILLCLIGLSLELLIAELSVFTLTYLLCGLLLYSFRTEFILERDPLTKLYNREILFNLKNDRRKKGNKTTALYLIDVDKFKIINDTFGHDSGDVVLKELANVLNNSVRSTDYVIRYGGDEFVIIASIGEPNNIAVIPNKINANLANYNEKHLIKFTISIGGDILNVNTDGKYNIDEMLKIVDNKMYINKNKKVNKCR